jgi:hypothetical protein
MDATSSQRIRKCNKIFRGRMDSKGDFAIGKENKPTNQTN